MVVGALWVNSAYADNLRFLDPRGDDNGPGSYQYPSDSAYAKGSFDLRKVTIKDKGDTVEVVLTFGARIKDPWNSKSWGGNGFSLQMGFVFIDVDHKVGSGHKKGLPGLNIQFEEESRWEKVLIISPQGNRRLKAEINAKAKAFKSSIVLPRKVIARGKSLKAVFSKQEIGGLKAGWGYQVLVQSNEGYPGKGDFLTRKVNEFRGAHRFGGGNDYNCDPHVIDMLAGKGRGKSSEVAAQHKALKSYECNEDDPEVGGRHATIPMVYP
jgi:carbohydrate-binding DOMON domain-containing protein